jgi:hypothetical protein|tara:strand:- start:178 stop:378 length:201 start_codon:yes stop_codon:yes gene_type:complete
MTGFVNKGETMKLTEAIKEASLSIACLLDDIERDENNDLSVALLEEDLFYIQKMITIIENNCEVTQ